MIASKHYKYHRHSIRLADYDYSQPGCYFITVCTHGRIPLFGGVVECQMQWNEYGRLAQTHWMEIPLHFPNVTLDEFVVMPDHIHGIIEISDVGPPDMGVWEVGAQHAAPLPPAPLPAPGSIPAIVRSYKSAVTKYIHEMDGTNEIQVRQRNYWEHIIRNNCGLDRIRYYLQANPRNWNGDLINPGEEDFLSVIQ